MKMFAAVAGTCLLVAVFASMATAQGNWIAVFDGKTLNGFDPIGDANWHVADGAVVAKELGPRGGLPPFVCIPRKDISADAGFLGAAYAVGGRDAIRRISSGVDHRNGRAAGRGEQALGDGNGVIGIHAAGSWVLAVSFRHRQRATRVNFLVKVNREQCRRLADSLYVMRWRGAKTV